MGELIQGLMTSDPLPPLLNQSWQFSSHLSVFGILMEWQQGAVDHLHPQHHWDVNASTGERFGVGRMKLTLCVTLGKSFPSLGLRFSSGKWRGWTRMGLKDDSSLVPVFMEWEKRLMCKQSYNCRWLGRWQKSVPGTEGAQRRGK